MIKVLKFQIRPNKNTPLSRINEIFKLAHCYYNEVAQVYNDEEEVIDNLCKDGLEQEIAKKNLAYQNLKIVEEKINDYKIQHQTRKINDDLKSELELAKEYLEDELEVFYQARKKNWEAVTSLQKEVVKNIKNSNIKNIREYYSNTHNLYWGTYNLITGPAGSVTRVKKSKFLPRNKRIGKIKYKNFDKTGRLGVQIQSKSSSPIDAGLLNIFNTNSDYSNLINIERKNTVQFEKGKFGHGTRSQEQGILNFCIETKQEQKRNTKGVLLYNKDGSPKLSQSKSVLAEFDILLNKSIPDNAMLLGAVINKQRSGNKIEWSLDLTVKCNQQKVSISNGKYIAFDANWRKVDDDTIQIAGWKDSDNKQGFIYLNIFHLNKAESLQIIRDHQFNKAKSLLSSFLSQNNTQIPQWLMEQKNFIPHIKSQNKLSKIIKFWQNNRFISDDEIFNALFYWKYRNRHLFDYERGIVSGYLKYRKQQFQIIAKDMASKYQGVIFENLQLDNMAKGKVGGENRQKSSPSEFKNSFSYHFTPNNIYEKSAANTSKECYNCHSLQDLDSANIMHTCTNCGYTYHRDINSPINLLQRFYKEDLQNVTLSLTYLQDSEIRKICESTAKKAPVEPRQVPLYVRMLAGSDFVRRSAKAAAHVQPLPAKAAEIFSATAEVVGGDDEDPSDV